MPIPLIMPKVDMDQEKATIISWSKAEGETVKQEETLLVVETEKVAIDVPSPASGVLVGLKYKPGDVVPVATIIAFILKPGETLADLPGGAPAQPPVEQSAAPSATPVDATLNMRLTPPKPASPLAMRVAHELGIDIHQVPSSANRISKEDVEAFAASLRQTRAPSAAPIGKIAATPAARRIAEELGVPLAGISGSGPFGRIQAADVKPAIIGAPAPTTAPSSAGVSPLAPSSAERPAEIIPLAGMRLKIARRLQASFQEAPHIAETVEADVTRLEALRKRLNDLAAQNKAEKITLTAVLVKLIAWALERNPYLNASLLEDNIYLWKDVNIGVATALESGLIVPVVHNANQLSVSQIAARVNILAARAREGKLELSDVQRGTFTISNLGMYGIRQFRAVINPPESAILAIGGVVRKPVVVDDNDTIAVRPIINFTLSADHRVIDGVTAAKFLVDLVQVVENPELLYY